MGAPDAGTARLRAIWDAELEKFIVAWQARQDPPIPDVALDHDDASWQAYAAWFYDLGCHVAQTPYDIVVHRRPSRLNPRRYLSRGRQDDGPQPSGDRGFLLPVGDSVRDQVAVTREGAVIPVHLFMDEATYWGIGTGDHWLDRGEPFPAVRDEVVLEAKARMWLQTGEWRRRPQ